MSLTLCCRPVDVWNLKSPRILSLAGKNHFSMRRCEDVCAHPARDGVWREEYVKALSHDGFDQTVWQNQGQQAGTEYSGKYNGGDGVQAFHKGQVETHEHGLSRFQCVQLENRQENWFRKSLKMPAGQEARRREHADLLQGKLIKRDLWGWGQRNLSNS